MARILSFCACTLVPQYETSVEVAACAVSIVCAIVGVKSLVRENFKSGTCFAYPVCTRNTETETTNNPSTMNAMLYPSMAFFNLHTGRAKRFLIFHFA